MSDLNLSKKEEIVFSVLKSQKEVAGEDISAALKKSRMALASDKSLIVFMKYLTAKVAPKGYIIEMTNGIGRGNKAIYKMEKRF